MARYLKLEIVYNLWRVIMGLSRSSFSSLYSSCLGGFNSGLSKVRESYPSVQRVYTYLNSWRSPSEHPSHILGKVKTAANEALIQAKEKGISTADRDPNYDTTLNEIIKTNKRNRIEQPPKSAPRDEDEKMRAHWKSRQEMRQKELKEKVSIFVIFNEMRNRCGFIEKDNFKLLKMVNQVKEGVSVWKVFTQNYQLGFFQKLFAAFAYWFYYQTSLIHNTVDAYLNDYVSLLADQLTTDDDKSRLAFFQSFIKNTKEFLDADDKVMQAYANGQEGPKEKLQDEAVERVFGSNLMGLCEKFTQHQMKKLRPNVKFFETLQNIPVIKYLFIALEYLINRFIIKRYMRSMLPFVLHDGIRKGLKETEPSRLPFKINLTKFITQRLSDLRSHPNASPIPYEQILSANDMKELEGAAELFLKVIHTHGINTADELKKKFADLENEGFWNKLNLYKQADKEILKGLEKAMIEGCNQLFGFLNERAKTGELFVQSLESILELFSLEDKTPETLATEYKNEFHNLETVAEPLFKEIVTKALAPPNEQTKLKVANDTAEDQTKLITESIERISQLNVKMHNKLLSSKSAPTALNSIHEELISSLRYIEKLTRRQELTDELSSVDATHRNEIWKSLAPLYNRLDKVTQEMALLIQLQYEYPLHYSIMKLSEEIDRHIMILKDQLDGQYRDLRNPQILASINSAKELMRASASLEVEQPQILNDFISKSAESAQAIAKEQRALDAIFALSPPRIKNGKAAAGLLDQLYAYHKGWFPQYHSKECFKKIKEQLTSLLPEERKKIESIIGLTGKTLLDRREELSRYLQTIYESHSDTKARATREFNTLLDETKSYLSETGQKYSEKREEIHRQMLTKIGTISEEVTALRKGTNLNPPMLAPFISKEVWYKACTAAPFIGGAIDASMGNLPLYSTLFSLGSSMANHLYFNPTQPDITTKSPEATLFEKMGRIGKVAFGSLVALKYITPALPAQVSEPLNWGIASLASWDIGKTASNLGRYKFHRYVFDTLWGKFKQGYSYISSNPHVYKALMTRSMKESSEAN